MDFVSFHGTHPKNPPNEGNGVFRMFEPLVTNFPNLSSQLIRSTRRLSCITIVREEFAHLNNIF